MITQEEIAGRWQEMRGKIKHHWGALTEDELRQCEGNVEELVGLIQRKTGEARAEVEDRLHQMIDNSQSYFADARQKAEQFSTQASEAARQQFGQAEELVRRRPAESVIVAFGTGMLLGVVVGLISRSK